MHLGGAEVARRQRPARDQAAVGVGEGEVDRRQRRASASLRLRSVTERTNASCAGGARQRRALDQHVVDPARRLDPAAGERGTRRASGARSAGQRAASDVAIVMSPPAARERQRDRRRPTPSAARTGALCQRAWRSARRTKSGRTALSSGRSPRSVTASVASSVSGIEAFSGNRSESKRASENSTRSRAAELAGGLRRGLRRACAGRTDGHRSGRRAARRGPTPARRRRCGPRRRHRPRRLPRHRAATAATTTPPAAARGSPRAGRPALLPVGRRVAAEVEEALEGVEDGVAATAAHPALGDLELVLDDSKRRPARGAARRQAHRQIMPCGGAGSRADEQDPAVVLVGDVEIEPRRVGAAQLVGLAREDAREHERAAAVDQRRQQRREQLERRGQDVGDDELIRPDGVVAAGRRERDAVGERVRLASPRPRPDRCRPHRRGARRTGSPRSRGRPSRSRSRATRGHGDAGRAAVRGDPAQAHPRRRMACRCRRRGRGRAGSPARASAGTSDQVGTIQKPA